MRSWLHGEDKMTKLQALVCVVVVVGLFTFGFSTAGFVAVFIFFEPVLKAFGLDGDIP